MITRWAGCFTRCRRTTSARQSPRSHPTEALDHATTKSPPSTMFSNGGLRENGAKPTTTLLEKEEEGKGRRRTQHVAAPACAHAPTCCAPPWPFVLFVSYTSTCVYIHSHVLHIYIYMHYIYIYIYILSRSAFGPARLLLQSLVSAWACCGSGPAVAWSVSACLAGPLRLCCTFLQ